MLRRFRTVDVFTRTRFGGNPLAVILDADGLDDGQMQAIAREFNYAETSFVRRATNPRHTAEVRIFTTTREVPFAGHPNIGTAFVLATLENASADRDEFVFEERAGLVHVRLIRESGVISSTQLTAPHRLEIGSAFDLRGVAECLGVSESEINTACHEPRIASVGLPFLVVELTSRDALRRARPQQPGFENILPAEGADAIYLYTRDVAECDGAVDFTARMFVPSDGVPEDPATGSATGAAAALISAFHKGQRGTAKFRVAQGVDMGRPSQLDVEVDHEDGTTTEVRVGGACVPVMSGTIDV